MGKWEIAKEFEFDYSHRVWSQDLNFELSLTNCNKCRFPHGHRGKVVVYLESTELKNGMVMDFVELGWFKKWVDDVLDHKCILDINDPTLPHFYPVLSYLDGINSESIDKHFQWHNEGNYFTIWEDLYQDAFPPSAKEVYQGLVFVPFVPTSENLSKWLWEIVNEKIGHLCKVSRVQFYETPKSQSNYYSTN